jgi:hypothetical protein
MEIFIPWTAPNISGKGAGALLCATTTFAIAF